MKTILLGCCIFLSIIHPAKKILPLDYIKLEFGGGSLDKSIPNVIFSIEPFYGIESRNSVVYYIDRCEYLLISHAIKEENIAHRIDTSDVEYYNFLILNNNKKSLYGTSTTEETIKMFKLITSQIQDSVKRIKVNEMILDIAKMILR